MRIVLVEPSHWHFEMYRPGIVKSGADVVGVVDRDAAFASRLASEFCCPSWGDLADMLDTVLPDFAFAFGAHDRMPAIAKALIERGVPFSMEKPGAIHSSDLCEVNALASAAGLYVSVPFHYRLSSMAEVVKTLVPLPSAEFSRFDFHINAGSPLRFSESSPWLVEPDAAGGGSMMNLAHHAIDFIVYCVGASVVNARASISNSTLGLSVEDEAVLLLTLSNGATASITTGYTHSAASGTYMGFTISMAHATFIARREGAALAVRHVGVNGERMIPVDWTFKHFFAEYAYDTLARCQEGAQPVAGLDDLLVTLQVVEKAYSSSIISHGLERVSRLHRVNLTKAAHE